MPSPSRSINLLGLPEELLVHIASFLDVESWLTLAQVTSRLQHIPLAMHFNMRKETSSATLDFVHKNRFMIRSMNLSSCDPSFYVLGFVYDFRHLTELNLVNSLVTHAHLMRILVFLRELRSLSFTMEREAPSSVSLGPFRRLKKIYVEVPSSLIMCTSLMNLLNDCPALHSLQVQFFGKFDWSRSEVPALAAERWETLHTVVCSGVLSRKLTMFRIFLRKLFFHNSSIECSRWIREDNDSYVYQNGYFNGATTKQGFDLEMMRKAPLIHHNQTIEVSREKPLETTRGFPRSLRVYGYGAWESELSRKNLLGSLSQLTELDLMDCHSEVSGGFPLFVIDSAPFLKVLALPVCFLVPLARYNWQQSSNTTRVVSLSQQNEVSKDGLTLFSEALTKLKLEKFFLGSGVRRGGCRELCVGCETKLSGDDLVDLSDLAHLKEVNFYRVRLDESAYEKMGSPNVQTARLHISGPSDFSGLRDFVLRCPNLENFQLLNSHTADVEDQIAQALIAARKLKQLYLSVPFCDTPAASTICEMIPELSPDLEVLRLLFPYPTFVRLEPFITTVNQHAVSLNRNVYVECSKEFFANVKSMNSSQYIKGRILCATETFVGHVKPLEWGT